MAWVWTGVGVVGLSVAALCFAAGVVVYASNARALANRLLALVLLGRGGLNLGGMALMYLTDDPAAAYGWQMAAWVVYWPVPLLYIAFLTTLPTPLSRRLAAIRPALYALAVAVLAWTLMDPRAFLTGVTPGTFAPWDVAGVGIGYWVMNAASIVAGLLGLLVAIWMYVRAAPGTTGRAQALAYLAAFAAFDLGNIGISAFVALFETYPLWLLHAQLGLDVAFVLLLAYGVLKTQLFDIDLKVKWTIRQSTVAAVFVGVFFVASEAAAAFFSERIGTYAGIAAAGLLVLAVAPLQRVAERVSDRALPRVQDTAEYRLVKKREVYRAAVEGALQDGDVSERERAVLARLADELGLTAVEMHEVERQARGARQGAA